MTPPVGSRAKAQRVGMVGLRGPGWRGKEARGFLKTGTTNVTSWKSFMEEFDFEDSELRKGHVWAVQEHKLADEHACIQAQDDLAQYGWQEEWGGFGRNG